MAIEKERLRERDAKNAQELKEWRQSLTSRKNVCSPYSVQLSA